MASLTLEQRFWAKVNTQGPIPQVRPDLGPCWIWTASTVSGYGHVFADGKFVRAHRLAYEWLIGSIPDGLILDHLCETRPCVRPSHLNPTTIPANALRSPKHNAYKTHCPAGHPYDEGNTIVIPRGAGTYRRCRACQRGS